MSTVTPNIGLNIPEDTDYITDKKFWDDNLNKIDTSLYQLKKFVTYELFGAKLNGVDDDTQAIIDAHNFANTNNLKVIQNSGTIYLKSTATLGSPVIKTDTNLTGCTIKIDETMANNNLYIVDSDDGEETITVDSTMQSQLKENALVIPALTAYKFSIFSIASSEILAMRENNIRYTKQEPFTIGTNGVIMDGGLLLDYTTGTLTLKRRSILDKPITVKGAVLDIRTTDPDRLACAFLVQRSNSTIQGIRVKVNSMPNASTTYNFKSSLIQVVKAYNVTLDKIIGENVGTMIQNTADATQGQYVFNFGLSSKGTIQNCILQRGWGVMNTEFVKNITAKDCVLNRVDNHFGLRDMFVERVRFVGNNAGVKIGWGKGLVSIRDCVMDYTDANSTVKETTFVTFRPDLSLCFEGKVMVDDIEINVFEDNVTFYVAKADYNSNFDYQTNRQHIFPEINMKNVRIKSLKTNLTVYTVFFQVAGSYYQNKNFTVQDITVQDIKLIDESSTKILNAIKLNNGVQNGISQTIRFTSNVKNVGNLTKSTYNQSVSMIEFDDTNNTVNHCLINIDNVVGKVLIANNFKADITANRLIGEISYVNTGRMDNVNLSNCDLKQVNGALNLKANDTIMDTMYVDIVQNISLNNCTLTGTEITRAGVTQSARLYNCKITPSSNSGNTYTLLKLANVIMKDCELFPYVYNGTSLPFYVDAAADTPLLLIGNVLKGTANSQTVTDHLYKYINSTYAQPTV